MVRGEAGVAFKWPSRRECADKAGDHNVARKPAIFWMVYTIHSPRGCCIICIYPMVYTIGFSGRIGDYYYYYDDDDD